MFDDVSGFGAWHRRWVVLEGNTLSFWKYPENERAMGKLSTNNILLKLCLMIPFFSDPIGRIDLGACVTSEVSIAPREICSRMHTFMLETSRAANKGDKDSLVVQTQGKELILFKSNEY